MKIEITEYGISVRVNKTQTLFDAEGNEVVVDQTYHREAVGAGDVDDADSFKARVVTVLDKHGFANSSAVAEVAAEVALKNIGKREEL